MTCRPAAWQSFLRVQLEILFHIDEVSPHTPGVLRLIFDHFIQAVIFGLKNIAFNIYLAVPSLYLLPTHMSLKRSVSAAS